MSLSWSTIPCDDLTVHEARDEAGQTVGAVVRDEAGRYRSFVDGIQVGLDEGRMDLDGAKQLVRRKLGAAA